MLIRKFRESDIDALINILMCNGQYDYPEVEGGESMKRVASCEAAVFLIAEEKGRPCGLIKAVYDGSRALIHLLSIHPDFQGQGFGTTLVTAAKDELHRMGANTFSVTVTDKSSKFWEKLGFRKLPVFVMLDDGKGSTEASLSSLQGEAPVSTGYRNGYSSSVIKEKTFYAPDHSKSY